MALIVTILVLQPDIGMTLMIVLTWGFQMFLAGMPMLLVIGIVALAPLGLFLAYLHLDHVKLRIEKFIEGGAWQVEQAKHSFANGGLLGVGPGALPSDAAMLGIDPGETRARMHEALEIIL